MLITHTPNRILNLFIQVPGGNFNNGCNPNNGGCNSIQQEHHIKIVKQQHKNVTHVLVIIKSKIFSIQKKIIRFVKRTRT